MAKRRVVITRVTIGGTVYDVATSDLGRAVCAAFQKWLEENPNVAKLQWSTWIGWPGKTSV